MNKLSLFTKLNKLNQLLHEILGKTLRYKTFPLFFLLNFTAPASMPSSRCTPSFKQLRWRVGGGGIIVWIPATQPGPPPLSPSASNSHSLPSLFPDSPYSSPSPVSSFPFLPPFLDGWSLPPWCHFLFG